MTSDLYIKIFILLEQSVKPQSQLTCKQSSKVAIELGQKVTMHVHAIPGAREPSLVGNWPANQKNEYIVHT